MPEPTSEAWARIRYEYERTTRPVEDICAEHGISSGTLRDRMRRWRWQRRRPPIPRDGPPPVPVTQHAVAAPIAGVSNAFELTNARATNSDYSPPPCGEGLPAVAKAMAGLLARPPKRSEGGLGVGVVVDNPKSFTTTPLPDPPPQGGREQTESRETASHTQSGQGIGAPAESNPASIVQRLQGAVARVLPAIEAIIARLAAGPHHPREMEQAGRALGALTRTLRELNALLSQQNALAGNAYDDMPEDMDAFREELARRIRVFVESRRAQRDEAKPQET